MLDKRVEELTYNICRDFVKKEFPEEAAFYDIVWKALENLPKDWKGKSGKADTEKRLNILPEPIQSLVTPVILSIVLGILSNFLYDLLKKTVNRRIDKTTKKKVNSIAIEIAIDLGQREDLGKSVASFVFEYFEN